MIDYVERVAADVRHWAWINRLRGPSFGREDLCGWCAIASAELHRRLRLDGIETQIGLSMSNIGSHAYVLYDDHVVDVTATQFSEFRHCEVNILSVEQSQAYYFYETAHVFETADELRAYQQANRWSRNQQVRPRISNLSRRLRAGAV